MPTRGNLVTRVRVDKLFSSTTVASNAEVVTMLQEGALDMAEKADAYVLSATWSAVAGAQTYVLSGASAKVTGFLDLYWPAGGLIYTQSSGKTKTAPGDFRVVSEAWLDLHVPGWRDASASDTLQYVAYSYDGSGNFLLSVYPKSKTTTPSFKLFYKSRGVDMSDDGNYPWTDTTTNLTHTDPWQKGIAFYALHHFHKTRAFQAALAEYYWAQYLLMVAGLKAAQEKVWALELDGSDLEAQMVAQDSFGSL